jgi:hypothetical protein
MKQFLAILVVLSLITSACGVGTTLPPPGSYAVKKDSVQFDGERYQLYYTNTNGSVQRLETNNLKMVRDNERTYLEVPQTGDPILHLREDEPITVHAQDNSGAFSSPWFPFLLGTMVGNAFGGNRGPVIINQPAPGERTTYGANQPSYRYPPTGTFGRNEQLHGSLDASRPQTPDYTKVQPQPYATSGQSSGTGGGAAASNKAPSSSTAATNKGGFAKGTQSYSNRVGAGSAGALKGTGPNVNKPSTGVTGGGKGVGSARPPARIRR